MHHFSCYDYETAERFALNRLGPSIMEAFEEHLLVCSACVSRVQEATEYVAVFRAAASALEPASGLPLQPCAGA